MLNVGVTGNVAAGKSAVVRWFERWGATVIDADQLVREAEAPCSPTLAAIAREFGPDVLQADGALDRAALRRQVLDDPARLKALNRIVHPEVARRRGLLLEQARARGARIVVNDIPLLFEVMDPDSFDAVVLVDAPVELRHRRLVEQRGLSSSDADRLIATQLPSATKRARSRFVIDNDGSLAELEQRARAVWREIEGLSAE